MRFTISREKLQEGLTAVAASIPAKTTLPVLANILVETTDKGIRLSGTDLDIAVSTEVQADVESSGAITIPAKKLSEIARELPPSPVMRMILLPNRGSMYEPNCGGRISEPSWITERSIPVGQLPVV